MPGPIRWFVHNPIAANLLMVFLLIGGALAIPSLDKQFFPDFELNIVRVSLPYPGAGPSEVEQQIAIRIEEAVHDLQEELALEREKHARASAEVVELSTRLERVKAAAKATATASAEEEQARADEHAHLVKEAAALQVVKQVGRLVAQVKVAEPDCVPPDSLRSKTDGVRQF